MPSATARFVWLLVLALGLAAPGCEAPARETLEEICNNQIDDDHNALVDCADPACATMPICLPEICGNNVDDDGDGRFDCADTDCQEHASCGGVKCGNGTIDPGEDCDGNNLAGRTCITQGFKSGALVCQTCAIDTSACSHTAPEACNNDVDDDGDGMVDCDDTECAETDTCLCGNGVVDFKEVCDTAIPPVPQSCQSLGFPDGALKCAPGCGGMDASGCVPPRCGDGFVSVETERCDDGNTVSGDGCDETCQLEVTEFCAAAPTLSLGVNTGDTTGASTGFESNCMPYPNGAERVYHFTPAQNGTLTLVVSSVANLGLHARSSCGDPTTELACANHAPGGASDAISIPVTAGQAITVFVDSNGPEPFTGGVDFGPFTLLAVLNP